MVNGWDGNLKIDTSGNAILAQTLIAGKKEEITNNGVASNVFTGIMAGTIGQSSTEKTGFFGFNKGVQTVFINAEDGSAKFGASSTAGFEWSLDPKPGNSDNSYLSFKIVQGTENKELLKISRSKYYLKSANYNDWGADAKTAEGTYINLFQGEIYCASGTFSSSIKLKSNEYGTKFKDLESVLSKLSQAITDAAEASSEAQVAASQAQVAATLASKTADRTAALVIDESQGDSNRGVVLQAPFTAAGTAVFNSDRSTGIYAPNGLRALQLYTLDSERTPQRHDIYFANDHTVRWN